MNDAIRQLDERLSPFRSLRYFNKPGRGWLRAVRSALGMTTAQFAKRMGVSQPRVVAIEKAEVSKAITLKTLERAAEAVGCRVVYLLIPDHSFEETVHAQAQLVADKQLATLGQTMRLEDQSVKDKKVRDAMRDKLVEDLVSDPARLWGQKW